MEGTIAAMAMSAAQGDIIKELRAEIERLRAALESIAGRPSCNSHSDTMGAFEMREIALRALEQLGSKTDG